VAGARRRCGGTTFAGAALVASESTAPPLHAAPGGPGTVGAHASTTAPIAPEASQMSRERVRRVI
jgi:hypothetical protein